MGPECSYSFADLFSAVHGRAWSESEHEEFMALTQEQKNKRIAQWAQTVGWGTELRQGTDGQQYLAFCPLWKA